MAYTLIVASLTIAASASPWDDYRVVGEERLAENHFRARFAFADHPAHLLEYRDSAIVRTRSGNAPIRSCIASGVAGLACNVASTVTPLMESARLWWVHAPGVSGAAIARHYSVQDDVVYALPDLLLEHRFAQPRFNDPRVDGQWYFERIALDAAWALSVGSPDTTVVVVDNGCDFDHPDLAAKLDGGRDVLDGDDDASHRPGTGNAHGTACAGLVGATPNNNEGIVGACPNCRLRCVRLLSDEGGGVPLSADVRAFDYAVEVGAAVVSNSWGFANAVPVPTPLRDAINAAYDEGRSGLGTVVVFAVGNDGRTIDDTELLAVRGVLGVGAINQFDEATSFSNSGAAVDLVAPVGTLTTDIQGPGGYTPEDYTSTFGGTSSACPIVAGVAGLLASADAGLTAEAITTTLIATTRPATLAVPGATGRDALYGSGVVDPTAALRSALGIENDEEPSEGSDEASDGSCAQFGNIAPLALLRRRRRRRAVSARGKATLV